MLVSRDLHPEDTTIKIDSVVIGEKRPVIIAGPCAVESKKQILSIAKELKSIGVDILRGGCYKPRTSPYSFQGIGEEGLEIEVHNDIENCMCDKEQAISIEEMGNILKTLHNA